MLDGNDQKEEQFLVLVVFCCCCLFVFKEIRRKGEKKTESAHGKVNICCKNLRNLGRDSWVPETQNRDASTSHEPSAG